MALPEPRPGLVVRYDYLWTHEAAAGRDQGKDRPACIVAATDSLDAAAPCRAATDHPYAARRRYGRHRDPGEVKQAIGLDEAPSWVIVSEHNVDEWPNAGLSPVPGKPGVFAYGFIPPGLFKQIKSRFLELARQGRTEVVRR